MLTSMGNRKLIPMAVLAFFLFAPQYENRAEQNSTNGAPSLTELEVPNKAQKKQIQDLIQQIAEVETSIAAMKNDLDVLGKVQDGKTVINVTATYMGNPGNIENRFFINEIATIHWDGERIGKFEFFRRQARVRGIYIIRKTMTADSMAQAAKSGALEVPIAILVEETLDSGRGIVTQFKLPGPGQDSIKDYKELVESGQGKKEVATVYLRQVQDRLDILRRYLQSMRDTERIIRYLIRNKIKSDHYSYERTKSIK